MNENGGIGCAGLLMKLMARGGAAGPTAAVIFPESEKIEVSAPIGVKRSPVEGAPGTSEAC